MIQLAIAKKFVRKRVNTPYTISRSIFNALSPLDQTAARALELCGIVKIVDDSERTLFG